MIYLSDFVVFMTFVTSNRLCSIIKLQEHKWQF